MSRLKIQKKVIFGIILFNFVASKSIAGILTCEPFLMPTQKGSLTIEIESRLVKPTIGLKLKAIVSSESYLKQFFHLKELKIKQLKKISSEIETSSVYVVKLNFSKLDVKEKKILAPKFSIVTVCSYYPKKKLPISL